eukprot:GFUD01111965.1.p1 GENE.GFUD01111965.1~~GFUD01111965.1.p1  ORF type:complete len:348 (+),score=61.06 GFUD01111965.1:101-1144(+)
MDGAANSRHSLKQELVNQNEEFPTKSIFETKNNDSDINVKHDTTWVVDENQAMHSCIVNREEQDTTNDVTPVKESKIESVSDMKVEVQSNFEYCHVTSSYEKESGIFSRKAFRDEELAIKEEAEDGNENYELVDIKERISESCQNTSNSFDEKLIKINLMIGKNDTQIQNRHNESIICSHCGKKLRSKTNLRLHELRIHGNASNKSFPCQVCDKVFYISNDLRDHKKRKHGNNKPKVCDICGKGFYDNGDLRKHQRILHENYRPFSCDICCKTFAQKHHLDVHRVIHTGERNYHCTEEGCDKSFKQKWHLVQHERLHSGVKPYQCKYCGLEFTQKSSLVSHIKTHNK